MRPCNLRDHENERPESDDEEEDEEDDPGIGEIDGEDRPFGVVDVDEDEESDVDEEETETARRVNGSNHQANGFRVERVEGGEEIDDVVEMHKINDGDDEEEPRRK
ncbi:hypothetical protein SO802_033367 [Lithocarpus litseifolius]|uniref:Uncharacterized protein n=1 Tax=Lithocarpus litseifolius TaxID=425828 RepID=A0AAW2BFM5_9ROSI